MDRPTHANPALPDLSAHLRSTAALIEYYIQSEKHGSLLFELKAALEHAIMRVDAAEAAEGPAKSSSTSKSQIPHFETIWLIIKALENALGADDPAVIETKELVLPRIAELYMIDEPDADELLAIVPPPFRRR